MIGICRLYLKDGMELQRSHLLSAAIYRILRDDGRAANPNPVLITPEGQVQSSKQQWAHLLCPSCEAILSREGEDWIFRQGMKNDGSSPVADVLRRSKPLVGTLAEHTRLYESVLIPDINAAAIIHFATGIFWKASIHGWNTDRTLPVNLGGYTDEFRRFLLGQADFPKDAVLAVMLREGGAIDRLTHTPAGIACGEVSRYQFPIPGFSFVLTIGAKIPERTNQYCCVRGLGKPISRRPRSNSFCFSRSRVLSHRCRVPRIDEIVVGHRCCAQLYRAIHLCI